MKEYVSVDVETTGLAPKQDKIIEIGAVRVRDGQIVGSFTCFVNPGRILPAHITELTGILQEQVDEAETMESVLPAFLEFAGDLPLVGHRILFDYGFLKRAAVNMRLDFERSGVDTLKLSRQFLSELPSRRLSALCEHFEIPIQAHRALELTGQGFGPTAAAKAAAQGTPYSKSEVYKQLLVLQQDRQTAE